MRSTSSLLNGSAGTPAFCSGARLRMSMSMGFSFMSWTSGCIRAARNARRGAEIRIVGSVVEASRSRSVTIADAADDALCLSDPIPDHRQESAHVADMVVRGGAVPHALPLGFILISAQQLVQEPLPDE